MALPTSSAGTTETCIPLAFSQHIIRLEEERLNRRMRYALPAKCPLLSSLSHSVPFLSHTLFWTKANVDIRRKKKEEKDRVTGKTDSRGKMMAKEKSSKSRQLRT